MRLINTDTLEFEEFFGRSVPPYAILSHITGFDEFTYRSFLNKERTDRAGYKKIVDFCSFAQSRGLGWASIDRCCINSSSSAEVSEAINSVFAWFQDATECYAQLSDVPALSAGENAVMRAFERSRWFTRVWTLPELLAPKRVIFLNTDWAIIGVKDNSFQPSVDADERNLNRDIAAIPGIPLRFLMGEDLSKATFAERDGDPD
ncbi:hypothetical protein LTR37_013264 [Vermiconidia calcicola]|uniref:Uncharacterized protein n=1 Tax=Vermiconidia calcicola TaxID=1690605 RepID=A0ACC3MYB8_9PEZI|nr:hypothetical protein LTR37_013264 [Vermiconidia calcicola]